MRVYLLKEHRLQKGLELHFIPIHPMLVTLCPIPLNFGMLQSRGVLIIILVASGPFVFLRLECLGQQSLPFCLVRCGCSLSTSWSFSHFRASKHLRIK